MLKGYAAHPDFPPNLKSTSCQPGSLETWTSRQYYFCLQIIAYVNFMHQCNCQKPIWGWLKESPCNVSVLRIQMLVFHVSNWLIFIFGRCELGDWPESLEPNPRPSSSKSHCNLCFQSHPWCNFMSPPLFILSLIASHIVSNLSCLIFYIFSKLPYVLQKEDFV